jgi:membrane-bound lytic murein transglycosylase
VAGLRHFAALGRTLPRERFLAAVRAEFDVYEATLAPDFLVTSYYAPRIDGARAATARFTQPLYAAPPATDVQRFTRAQIDSGRALAGRGLELCWVDPVDAFVLQTEGAGEVALDDGSTLALNYAANNGLPYGKPAASWRA